MNPTPPTRVDSSMATRRGSPMEITPRTSPAQLWTKRIAFVGSAFALGFAWLFCMGAWSGAESRGHMMAAISRHAHELVPSLSDLGPDSLTASAAVLVLSTLALCILMRYFPKDISLRAPRGGGFRIGGGPDPGLAQRTHDGLLNMLSLWHAAAFMLVCLTMLGGAMTALHYLISLNGGRHAATVFFGVLWKAVPAFGVLVLAFAVLGAGRRRYIAMNGWVFQVALIVMADTAVALHLCLLAWWQGL